MGEICAYCPISHAWYYKQNCPGPYVGKTNDNISTLAEPLEEEMTIPQDKVEAKIEEIIEERWPDMEVSDKVRESLYAEAELLVMDDLVERAEMLTDLRRGR